MAQLAEQRRVEKKNPTLCDFTTEQLSLLTWTMEAGNAYRLQQIPPRRHCLFKGKRRTGKTTALSYAAAAVMLRKGDVQFFSGDNYARRDFEMKARALCNPAVEHDLVRSYGVLSPLPPGSTFVFVDEAYFRIRFPLVEKDWGVTVAAGTPKYKTHMEFVDGWFGWDYIF